MKNARINTDLRLEISLKAGGALIDMTSIDVLSLYMYCNPQKARDGAIKHSASTSDAKVLEMIWPADVQRYLGSHSVHGTIRYSGAVASFDVPAVNVVSKTSEADVSTDTIVLEAPVGTEDLTATITIQGVGPQGPKGDKMTYADLTQEDKKDLYEGTSEIMNPLLDTKQNTLTDTDGSYGQRVAELEVGKQDTIVDLDDIREGAAKGATALQSYTETDPVYTADKPSLALKSELNGLSTQVTNLQTKDTEQDGRLVALEQRPIVDKGLTERVTDLENDRKYANNLANVRIKSLSVDEPIKVCDVPMVLIGSGAPSAANVPMNWDKVKMGEWFGIPNFIGQMYVNISASNNALYVAVNDTAVSGWKTA